MADSQILIVGGRGIVGSAIAAAAGERAIRAARLPVANGMFPFDALTDNVAPLIERMNPPPKAIVIAFGISGVHTCASDPIESRRLNVDRVLAVATAAAKSGALPVLFSTDCVFDGTPVLWSEQDIPNPICEYGHQKRAAEQAVAELGIPHLLLRLSRVVADHAGQRDILYRWCDQLRQGATIQLASDQSFTPIASADLGRIAVELIDSDVRGLIHVAGPEQVSTPALFDLWSDACRRLGVDLAVKRDVCQVSDLPGIDRRPPSTMLSIKSLERILAPKFMPLPDVVQSVAAAAFAAAPGLQPAPLPHRRRAGT
jgi:dTDP-4-dehydrorhamnose reductase